MSTAQSLITIIRTEFLDDPNPRYLWSDDFLLWALNNAVAQATDRSDIIQESELIPIVVNQADYMINSHFNRVTRVSIDGVDVCKTSIDCLQSNPCLCGVAQKWRTETGYPVKSFVQDCYKITLIKIPDYHYVGKSIKVEGFAQPLTAMTMADNIPIPESSEMYLIYWVLHQAYMKRDSETYDPAKVEYYRSLFESEFGPQVDIENRKHILNNSGLAINYTGSHKADMSGGCGSCSCDGDW